MSWLLFDLKKTIREFSGLWQLFVSNEDITSYRRCVLFAYDNRDSQTSTCREGTKVLGPDLSLVVCFFTFADPSRIIRQRGNKTRCKRRRLHEICFVCKFNQLFFFTRNSRELYTSFILHAVASTILLSFLSFSLLPYLYLSLSLSIPLSLPLVSDLSYGR